FDQVANETVVPVCAHEGNGVTALCSFHAGLAFAQQVGEVTTSIAGGTEREYSILLKLAADAFVDRLMLGARVQIDAPPARGRSCSRGGRRLCRNPTLRVGAQF